MRPPKPGDIVAYNAPDKFGRVAESVDLTLAKVESTGRKNGRPIVFLDNGS